MQLFDDLSSNFRETDTKVIAPNNLLRTDLPSKTRYKHTTAHTSLNAKAASAPKPSLSGSLPPRTNQHFLNFCLEIQAGDTKHGVLGPALLSGHSFSLLYTGLNLA